MVPTLLSVLAVVGGFVALLWGADRFVVGAAATARLLGVSPLLIGLTIVGFGTSAPELLVSTMASLLGAGDLAVGNAIGSCITNVALVLGAAALVRPLRVHSSVVRRELPMLLVVMVGAALAMADGRLQRWEGAALLAGLGLFVAWTVREGMRQRAAAGQHRRGERDPLAKEVEAEIPRDMTLGRALGWLLVGMVVLLAGSRALVWGGTRLAHALGVGELVVGLTVVALGTSLPEVAASVVAAFKGEHDLAVGNVVGSNLFNLLGVLGLPALLAPGPFDAAGIERDVPVMFAVTLLAFGLAHGFGRKGVLRRWHGALLLSCFVLYVGWLYVDSAERSASPAAALGAPVSSVGRGTAAAEGSSAAAGRRSSSHPPSTMAAPPAKARSLGASPHSSRSAANANSTEA